VAFIGIGSSSALIEDGNEKFIFCAISATSGDAEGVAGDGDTSGEINLVLEDETFLAITIFLFIVHFKFFPILVQLRPTPLTVLD
jgi:hypothetical protein